VNYPAQVSYFYDYLVAVATFDPIDMEEIYEKAKIFDFYWVSKEPNMQSLHKINIDDRNFIIGLGSKFLFLIYLVVCILTRLCLKCIKLLFGC
jgi:hypothetical protein